MNTWPQEAHPQLETLPEWTTRTIAVLATVDPAPHAIPVPEPVRPGDRWILLSMQRSRRSLARLRTRPPVALLILTAGDIALTARGTAHRPRADGRRTRPRGDRNRR